jgi:hypothetical protein
MSPAEVSGLSTAELDALIAAAAKERTKRPEPHPPQAPQEFDATFNPAWFVFLAGENTVFQFRHAGHGWVSIAIPPPERAHLLSLLLHHSLLGTRVRGGEPVAEPVPIPPSRGGGTVH